MKSTNQHNNIEFPNLEELKSKNGFTTPLGYFDSLPTSILSEISKEPKERTFIWYKTLAVASVIAIIVGVSITFNTQQEIVAEAETNTEIEFESLTASEYIEEFSEIDLELDLTFDEMAMNE